MFKNQYSHPLWVEKLLVVYFVLDELNLHGSYQIKVVLPPGKTQGHFLSVNQAVLPVSQWCGWLWLMVEEQIHSVLMYTVHTTSGYVLILNFQNRENSRSRKWSAADLTSNLGCFQESRKTNSESMVVIIIQGDRRSSVSLTLTSERASGSANQLAPVNFAFLTCSRLFY